MLAVYFSVFLAFFPSLQAVDSEFMVTDNDAKGAITEASKYGCSVTANDDQIKQAMICQQSVDANFYQSLDDAIKGECQNLITDTSCDTVFGNFCKSLKGPDDAKSIELMKCVFKVAGIIPDGSRAMNNSNCVAV